MSDRPLTPADLAIPLDAPELHIWTGRMNTGDVSGVLMTKHGEVLTEHISSSYSFLRGDLTTTFVGRAAELRERYGDALDRHLTELVMYTDGAAFPAWLKHANHQWAASDD